jgi:hypothetical protein
LNSTHHEADFLCSVGRVLNTEKERIERRFGGLVFKHSTRDMPLGPDEVLFRRRGAPERYAEHNIYYSNERDLPRAGRGVLPDNDLLKAIHSYSGQFYGAHRHRGEPNTDECSMEETALLAFGILLEEAGREVLGRRGDLVFTEAAADEQDASSGDEFARRSVPLVPAVDGHRQDTESRTRVRKRRRMDNSEGPGGTAMVDD